MGSPTPIKSFFGPSYTNYHDPSHASYELPNGQKEIVTTNLESLRNTIDLKRKNLETIVLSMRRKIAEIEAKRAEFKGSENMSTEANAWREIDTWRTR